jgi:hypothetical protein
MRFPARMSKRWLPDDGVQTMASRRWQSASVCQVARASPRRVHWLTRKSIARVNGAETDAGPFFPVAPLSEWRCRQLHPVDTVQEITDPLANNPRVLILLQGSVFFFILHSIRLEVANPIYTGSVLIDGSLWYYSSFKR